MEITGEQNLLEKEVHNKLPYMITDYILANDLDDCFCEHIYFTNHFISKDFVDKSLKACWARCYKIYYLSQYYFDGLLLFEEPGTITYDEYDYQDTSKKPIEFNKKENVFKPMMLLTLKKMSYQNLLFVANCLGISIDKIDEMIDRIKTNYKREEKLKEIVQRKQQIANIRQCMQNIKDGVFMIGEYIGKDCENEIKILEGLSNDVEKYINDLENQIESEQEMTLTLK